MSIKIIFMTKRGRMSTVTLVGHLHFSSIFNSSSVSYDDDDDDGRPLSIE